MDLHAKQDMVLRVKADRMSKERLRLAEKLNDSSLDAGVASLADLEGSRSRSRVDPQSVALGKP